MFAHRHISPLTGIWPTPSPLSRIIIDSYCRFWKSDSPTLACFLSPLSPSSLAFCTGSFLIPHKPGLISSLFKQTNKQTNLLEATERASYVPISCSLCGWCHPPYAVLLSLSLKPSLFRILPPFLFTRIAHVSKSGVLCVAKSSGLSSFLILLELEVVFDSIWWPVPLLTLFSGCFLDTTLCWFSSSLTRCLSCVSFLLFYASL